MRPASVLTFLIYPGASLLQKPGLRFCKSSKRQLSFRSMAGVRTINQSPNLDPPGQTLIVFFHLPSWNALKTSVSDPHAKAAAVVAVVVIVDRQKQPPVGVCGKAQLTADEKRLA
jgi:hypothetical protein